jgi:predicted NUDIX family NTP pyrophosphohydrolase
VNLKKNHPQGPFTPLGQIIQKGGKVVTAWAFEKNVDSSTQIESNLFEIEWPPHSGNFQKYPEIDRAEFFPIEIAKKKINPAQIEFINTLLDSIS